MKFVIKRPKFSLTFDIFHIFFDLSHRSSERYYFETKSYVYCVEQQCRLVWSLNVNIVKYNSHRNKFCWQCGQEIKNKHLYTQFN